MSYKVKFADPFASDLRKLDRQVASRILNFLTTRIDGSDNPRAYGQPLSGSRLGDLWRYRVGNWRIIADIRDETLTVIALHAGHRREVYRS